MTRYTPCNIAALVTASCLFGGFVTPVQAAPQDLPTAYLAVADEGLAPEGSILANREDATVAPSIHYTSFSRFASNGWLRGDLLTLDLTEEAFKLGYVDSGSVAETGTLTEQLTEAGAVAGVNGDGFDIGDTGAAHGVGVEWEGEVVKGYDDDAARRRGPSAVIGTDGLVEIAQLFLEGTVSDGEHTYELDYLNQPHVMPGEIGLFTARWGDVELYRAIDDPSNAWQVLLEDGVVVSSGAEIDEAGLAKNQQALVGSGAAVSELQEFTVGESVNVDYEMRGADDIATAINGFFPVALDGKVVATNEKDLHPRTVLAVTADGARMALLTIDGRQIASRGMTEVETAEFFLNLGYSDVLNLDGGGSSQMNARLSGDTDMTIRSSPSDGNERQTANSLGVFVDEGSATPIGFGIDAVNSTLTADDDSTMNFTVMEGLTRHLKAQGYNDVHAPVAANPTWKDPNGNLNIVTSGDGIATVTGQRAGTTTIELNEGGVSSALDFSVIGAPVRLSTSTVQVSLPDNDQTGTFQVFGHDQEGFSTWLEPSDVKLDYDATQVEVAEEGDGFRVRPVMDEGAAVITVEAGGITTQLAVTVGLTATVADELSTGVGWQATRYPSQMPEPSWTIAEGEGHDGGDAIAFDYSLTGTTATRAAYLAYPERIDLPGNPQRIGLWVHGDGQGAWLRGHLYQAGSTSPTVVNFDYVNWEGWRYVEAEIPAGLSMPLEFFRFYAVETNPERQYSGRLLFQDLTVRSAPAVPDLDIQREQNPAIVTSGEKVPEDWWRFAVVSDAQFTADAPQSDVVAAARRSLREALAQNPEFIVIAGDWVDRGFADDIALAKRILDEEVPDDVPVYYAPGNHEAAGPGNLEPWEKVFGEPWYTIDHEGTRLIFRSTPGYTLRSGGFEQIIDLKRQLDDAATNPDISNVVVVQHHPLYEMSPTGGSTIKDQGEIELLRDWFSEFTTSSGKGIALQAAGTGTFEARQFDGVHQFTTGNAGKGPNGSPDNGGFSGWSLVSINPESGKDPWIAVQFMPHVDELILEAPATAKTGEEVKVSATVVQDGRRVPVRYPIAGEFGVSGNAKFDPERGIFYAHTPGEYTITATVHGVTEEIKIKVSGKPQKGGPRKPGKPDHGGKPGKGPNKNQ